MGIDWTVYGKVKSVAKINDKVIEFFYDAAGNRIRKKVTPISPDASEENTFYVRDASGNVMATYTKSNVEITSFTDFRLKEQYIYGSSRVGLFVPDKTLATRTTITDFDPDLITHTTGLKQYELSNHLGNVLTTVSDRRTGVDVGSNNTIDYFTANVTSVTDYGVWGDQLPGRNANSADYKYGFNGKEKDDEWKTNGNSYDFGARIYDPRLGKLLSPDIKSRRYPMLSPYQFASNRPIDGIDLNGLEYVKASELLYGGFTAEQFFPDAVVHPRVMYDGSLYINVGQHLYRDKNALLFTSDPTRKNVGERVTSWLYTQVDPVIEKKNFVGWSTNEDCMANCRSQLKKADAEVSWSNARIQVYDASGLTSDDQVTEGIDVINKTLEKGKPIVVGVDYGETKAQKGNVDKVTDHFVTIVGRGHDDNGDFFTFYENATSDQTEGTNIAVNKLYIKEDGTLRGNTSWSPSVTFKVTMVRPTINKETKKKTAIPIPKDDL